MLHSAKRPMLAPLVLAASISSVGAANAQTFNVIYTFPGGAGGALPLGKIATDSSGNIWGTTISGGTAGFGIIYKVSPAGTGSVVYSFPAPGHHSTQLDPEG